jgi:chromosome segregation ATPase
MAHRSGRLGSSRSTWFDTDSKCVQTSDVTASLQETQQELQQLLSTQKSQIHGLEHDLENHESGSRDRDRHYQEMHEDIERFHSTHGDLEARFLELSEEFTAMIRQPIRSFEAEKHTIYRLLRSTFLRVSDHGSVTIIGSRYLM